MAGEKTELIALMKARGSEELAALFDWAEALFMYGDGCLLFDLTNFLLLDAAFVGLFFMLEK